MAARRGNRQRYAEARRFYVQRRLQGGVATWRRWSADRQAYYRASSVASHRHDSRLRHRVFAAWRDVSCAACELRTARVNNLSPLRVADSLLVQTAAAGAKYRRQTTMALDHWAAGLVLVCTEHSRFSPNHWGGIRTGSIMNNGEWRIRRATTFVWKNVSKCFLTGTLVLWGPHCRFWLRRFSQFGRFVLPSFFGLLCWLHC